MPGLTIQQDDFDIKLVGKVVPPPSVDEIVKKLREARAVKAPVDLSPGEVRVLTDHLEETTP
jgi:hypothetical protein